MPQYGSAFWQDRSRCRKMLTLKEVAAAEASR